MSGMAMSPCPAFFQGMVRRFTQPPPTVTACWFVTTATPQVEWPQNLPSTVTDAVRAAVYINEHKVREVRTGVTQKRCYEERCTKAGAAHNTVKTVETGKIALNTSTREAGRKRRQCHSKGIWYIEHMNAGRQQQQEVVEVRAGPPLLLLLQTGEYITQHDTGDGNSITDIT